MPDQRDQLTGDVEPAGPRYADDRAGREDSAVDDASEVAGAPRTQYQAGELD